MNVRGSLAITFAVVVAGCSSNPAGTDGSADRTLDVGAHDTSVDRPGDGADAQSEGGVGDASDALVGALDAVDAPVDLGGGDVPLEVGAVDAPDAPLDLGAGDAGDALLDLGATDAPVDLGGDAKVCPSRPCNPLNGSCSDGGTCVTSGGSCAASGGRPAPACCFGSSCAAGRCLRDTCIEVGARCDGSEPCCGGVACVQGFCGGGTCVPDGEVFVASGPPCCSGRGAPPGTQCPGPALCRPLGAACSDQIGCCRGGTCVNSACVATPCSGLGGACSAPSQCCSNIDVSCSGPGTTCAGRNCVVRSYRCDGSIPCCGTDTCVGGVCGCVEALQPCDGSAPCCTGTSCVMGVCAPTCSNVGRFCDGVDYKCCAGLACKNGLCAQPEPACSPNGGLCDDSHPCCSGVPLQLRCVRVAVRLRGRQLRRRTSLLSSHRRDVHEWKMCRVVRWVRRAMRNGHPRLLSRVMLRVRHLPNAQQARPGLVMHGDARRVPRLAGLHRWRVSRGDRLPHRRHAVHDRRGPRAEPVLLGRLPGHRLERRPRRLPLALRSRSVRGELLG